MKSFLFSLLFLAISTNALSQSWETIATQNYNGKSVELKRKVFFSDFKSNPDGTKFYKTEIGFNFDGNFKQIPNYFYSSDDKDGFGTPSLFYNGNEFYIYVLEHNRGYGMDGFVFRYTEINGFIKEKISQTANWGWYAYFTQPENGQPVLLHFSYAGYYKMKSSRKSNGEWETKQISAIKPEFAQTKYKEQTKILILDLPNKNNNTKKEFIPSTYWNSDFQEVSSIPLKDGRLILEKKLDLNNYRANPDNWKFYKTTFAIRIDRKIGSTRTIVETESYTSLNYTKAMLPCMLIDPQKNTIFIFTNSKSSDKMYGMDGFVYKIDLNESTWSKEIVFEHANFGWYSFFGGTNSGNPELWHFSYAGYYSMQSTRKSNAKWETNNMGAIKPENVDKQYYTHNNILWTSSASVDRMVNENIDYYKSYKSENYNSGASSWTLEDVKTGINFAAQLHKLWTNGTKVVDAIMGDTPIITDEMGTKITSCALQYKASNLTNNNVLSAALSESIKSIVERKDLDVKNMAINTFYGYVSEDLEKKGFSGLNLITEISDILACALDKK